MSDITISKISCNPTTIRAINTCTGLVCGTNSIPKCATITIRNFESLEFRLESPAGDFPIPETEDFGNIVVKAEGNRLSINVSWTIHEETTCIISGGTYDLYCPAVCAPTVQTVAQQIDYWLNVFQPYSIEAKYSMTVDGITRAGYIRSLSLSKSASTPVTYSANLDFIAGDVVAGE